MFKVNLNREKKKKNLISFKHQTSNIDYFSRLAGTLYSAVVCVLLLFFFCSVAFSPSMLWYIVKCKVMVNLFFFGNDGRNDRRYVLLKTHIIMKLKRVIRQATK